jgi:tight adherence protein B
VRRRLAAVGVAALAAIAAVAPAAAGAGLAGAGGGDGIETVSVDVSAFPDVRVVVAPTGPLAAADLRPSEFTVTAAGRRQAFTASSLATNALEVVLVIDTSGSMQPAMDSAKAAARGFIEAMPPTTRFAVVEFNDQARVLATDASASTALVAVDGLEALGGTALYDGLALAVRQVSRDSGRNPSMVLLSDGGDTRSKRTISDATAALAARHTNFYAVSLVTPDTNAAALDTLAGATGGRVVAVDDAPALAEVYGAIAAQLKHQYELRYRSSTAKATTLTVRLRHGGADVRTTVRVQPPAAAPARPAPAPRVVSAPDDAGWRLAAGAGAVFAALLFLGLLLFAPRERRRRLAVEAGIRRIPGPRAAWNDLARWASDVAERSLERRGRRRALASALEHAGIPLRPGEFLVLATGIALGGGVLGGVLLGGSVFVMLAITVALGFGARAYLRYKAAKRREAFSEQLPDTLSLLASHLRTGYGLFQALDIVAKESDPPTSTEFQRILTENRLGRDLSDALRAASERVGSEDFGWVVQAIEVHREVGGDLGEVLENVAATIRDREHLRRQVRALSADGRLSAAVLIALPIVVFVAMKVLNPDYANLLLDRTSGRVMLGGAVLLMAVGASWLGRIIRLRF